MTTEVLGKLAPVGNGTGFVNPWLDLASNYSPRTMASALDLCEFLYVNDSTYKKASERIVNYFLTDLKFLGQTNDERKKFERVVKVDFDIMGNLQAVGNDFMCYGNSFCTTSFPFTRVLVCRGCAARGTSSERNIEHIRFGYNASDGTFTAYCPKCRGDQSHRIKDYKKKDSEKIRMIRWDPKLITIKANRLTHDIEYWTEIPNEVRTGITSGDPFFLKSTPKPFIDAIRQNVRFKFNNTHLFHLKEPHLAGLWLGGWGLPSILSSFKNFFRLQILRRYNEALMMDYIVPIRIVSPAQGGYQDGNSIYNNLMRNWVDRMQDAVRRHRIDGTDWNFFPFPVNYQALGGEANQLAPKEHIADEEDRMLNGRGIPPELYRSTMTLQAAPISLRVFERTWSSLVRGLNLLAQDTTTSIANYMGSGDYECEIESVKIIDDLENKAWRLQAMSAGQLSKETAMGPMGVTDVREEFKKILQEQRTEAEDSQKAQTEMEMSQMGLGGEEEGAEGAEGQQGGGAQVTPDRMTAQAEEMARQFLGMPEGERRRQLDAIRQQNDTLHALILKKMDQIRNQARSQGMDQVLPQMVGGDASQQAATPQQ